MIPQHGQLEISRSRLRNNLTLLRERVGAPTALCATIKADAYGHGVAEVAGLLREAGVEWIAVYTLDEAAELGAANRVLMLAPMVLGDASDAPPQIPGNVRVNLTDADSARALSAAAVERGWAPVKVHVQMDVGLTRAGIDAGQAGDLADLIATLPGLELEGLFGHFSHGDVAGHQATIEELASFREHAAPMKARHPGMLLHLQNSGGAWHVGGAGLDMVRIGIAIYGLQPSMAEPIAGLEPIARVTAPILAIHERAAGTGVGYGHVFRTRRASRIAVVPVGYADGYPRGMTNLGAVVQLGAATVPLVGRVSMDQITLDVTDVPAKVGDRVTVISADPAAANCVDRLAVAVGTIGYELATHFGSRLSRIIVP